MQAAVFWVNIAMYNVDIITFKSSKLLLLLFIQSKVNVAFKTQNV